MSPNRPQPPPNVPNPSPGVTSATQVSGAGSPWVTGPPAVPRLLYGGLGQLADGVLGLDDFTRSRERRLWPGYDYVGWRRPQGPQPRVELEFEFEQLRMFHAMQVPQWSGDGVCGGVMGWLVELWGEWLGDGVLGWVMGWLVELWDEWLGDGVVC